MKILDFGLVKLTQPETARGQESHTPTLSKGTEPGVVMGTVGYMSPEQALGKAVDFRADQFSLGSILYELATGKRAFVRGSAPETLSAIIRDEPEPMANLSPLRPAPLRWIIERCLAKNPGDRYASTVDLARDLANLREHISEISGAAAALSPGTRPKGRERLAWVAAAVALVAGLAVGLLVRGRAAEGRSLARLSMTFLPGESPEPQDSPILALSPDGTRLVYVGRGAAGGHRLYVRELARFEATPIPGTDGGEGPFFSPDGQWVGFGADKQLKKVSLAGGQPLILCDAPTLRGASWGTDGTILFAPSGPAPA